MSWIDRLNTAIDQCVDDAVARERERAALIVEDLMPKNERSDWTEWARIRAEVLAEAAARIRDKRIAGVAPSQAPSLPDVIEQIAQEWDGCEYDAPGGSIPIGDAIRARRRLIPAWQERNPHGVEIPDGGEQS